MKVSFSLPSKPSSNPKPSTPFTADNEFNQNDAGSSIQYLHEFDPSKPLHGGDPNITRVIPPIPNEWLNKIQPSESLSAKVSNGLTIRVKPEFEPEPEILGGGDERPKSADEAAAQKLKEDLERLPEHRGAEEYSDELVEGFGAAVLAGYGWGPGKGIGKNATKDVKVVEFGNKRTNDRHGLGWTGQ